jgi:hypothetical protein
MERETTVAMESTRANVPKLTVNSSVSAFVLKVLDDTVVGYYSLATGSVEP